MKVKDAKTALVLGGSEGIGLAIARALAASGRRVVIASRNHDKLAIAAPTIPGLVATKRCDVSDWHDVVTLREGLAKDHLLPDLLVNCAGFARAGYLDDLSEQLNYRMMAINYFGCYHLGRAFAPHMVENRGGIIVNTSSMAGFIGLSGYTGYCATKFAIIGYSKALRQELAPFGVRVQVLCPTNTITPGFDEENKTKPREVLAAEQAASTLSPEQVAQYFMRAIAKNRFIMIPAWDGRLAYRLNRYVPALVDRMVRRKIDHNPSLEAYS